MKITTKIMRSVTCIVVIFVARLFKQNTYQNIYNKKYLIETGTARFPAEVRPTAHQALSAKLPLQSRGGPVSLGGGLEWTRLDLQVPNNLKRFERQLETFRGLF